MEKEIIITAIIADDEPLARSVIKNYLSGFPMIRVIAECENGLAALNAINAQKPDLLFLDIQMPELDGISMLSELKELPLVIFTTAYNQFAIRAFELNAIDYLLKPFDRNRFSQSLKRVLEHRSLSSSMEDKISNLQNSLDTLLVTGKNFISRILIKGKSGYSFIHVEEVLWIEAYADYIKIHSKDKIYLKKVSLAETESKLNPQQFIRIHRSTIVNISFIKEMKPYTNGEYIICLTNGEKLKLSRSYKDKISSIINESI